MLQNNKWLILTDMVHFYKNRRTQLIIFKNNNLLTAFGFAVRSTMTLDFQNDLETSFDVPKRENICGAHLDYSNSDILIYILFLMKS